MQRHGAVLLPKPDVTLPHRLARSALAVAGGIIPGVEAHRWIEEHNAAQRHNVRRIPFEHQPPTEPDPMAASLEPAKPNDETAGP